MKKLLLCLPVLILGACDKKTDYQIIQQEIGARDNPVLMMGKSGDFVIKIQESDALKKIANKEKTVKFFSVENSSEIAEEGFCLINIIPFNTWKAIGEMNPRCFYRIYCGNVIDYDNFYAVDVCE